MTQIQNSVPDGAVLDKKETRDRIKACNDFSPKEERSLFIMSEDELVQTANMTGVDISDCIDDLSAYENRAGKRDPDVPEIGKSSRQMPDTQSKQASNDDEDEDDFSWAENRASKRIENQKD